MEEYKDCQNDSFYSLRCHLFKDDIEEDEISFEASFFNELFQKLSEINEDNEELNGISIELCKCIDNIIQKHYNDKETMTSLLNYLNEHSFLSILSQMIISESTELRDYAFSCIINIFYIDFDNEIFRNECINKDFVELILSLINEDSSNNCFMALRNILCKRSDVFEDIDFENIVEVIRENLNENGLMLAATFVRILRKETESIIQLFIDSLEIYQKESMIGLFFIVKNNQNISRVLLRSNIFNTRDYSDNAEYYSLLVSEVIKYLDCNEKEEMLKMINWSFLDIETISNIIRYCPQHVNKLPGELISLVFDAAADGTFSKRKDAISTLCFMVKNNAPIERDFTLFAIDNIEIFEGDMLVDVLDTLSDIIVRENEDIQSFLDIINENESSINELASSENADIQKSAEYLIAAIEDRKLELEL